METISWVRGIDREASKGKMSAKTSLRKEPAMIGGGESNQEGLVSARAPRQAGTWLP